MQTINVLTSLLIACLISTNAHGMLRSLVSRLPKGSISSIFSSTSKTCFSGFCESRGLKSLALSRNFNHSLMPSSQSKGNGGHTDYKSFNYNNALFALVGAALVNDLKNQAQDKEKVKKEKNDEEMFLFLESFAKSNDSKDMESLEGYLKTLPAELRNKMLSWEGEYGTILHAATWAGNAVGMHILIAAGANVNQRRNDGWTALHLAASLDWYHGVELLINAGAKIDVKTYSGDTPLDLTYRWSRCPAIRFISETELEKLRALLNTPMSFHFRPQTKPSLPD